MTTTPQRKRARSIVLRAVLLGGVVAAAILPNLGVVQAKSSSFYHTATPSVVTPALLLGSAGAFVVLGVVVAWILLHRLD